MSVKTLIINASLGGDQGNSMNFLPPEIFLNPTTIIGLSELSELTQEEYINLFLNLFNEHDHVLFISGTYWDSWSSHLQYFLETITPLEAHPCLFGKPAGVLITMHSVGGKEVMSRLQGVLSTYGFLIPPHSGLVLSLATELARQSQSEFQDDFWSKEEIPLIIENLSAYSKLSTKAKPWSVDHKDPTRVWNKQ